MLTYIYLVRTALGEKVFDLIRRATMSTQVSEPMAGPGTGQ
jgi:hypothetical protein